jgi:hypothetical protein
MSDEQYFMDKFDTKRNTGEAENTFNFSELPSDNQNNEKPSLRQAKNA